MSYQGWNHTAWQFPFLLIMDCILMVKLLVVSLFSDRFCVINVSRVYFSLFPSYKRCQENQHHQRQCSFYPLKKNRLPPSLVMVDLSLSAFEHKEQNERPQSGSTCYCQFNVNYGRIVPSFTRCSTQMRSFVKHSSLKV